MKAKLAWICYDSEDDACPTIKFQAPERWYCYKIVPIVYFEVEKD